MEIFCEIVLPVIAAIIAVIGYNTSRKFYYIQRIHKITDRLYEFNKLLLQHSELIPFLSENLFRTGKYFIPETPHDETYFKIKTLIYFQFNLFDEIISTTWKDKKMEEALEFDNWKNYIIEKLRHPLYKELYTKDIGNWVKKFEKFVEEYHKEINEPPSEEYVL